MENLKRQAEKLTSTSLSLISVFAEEANRLNRMDEASRLKVLHSSIKQQFDQVKRREDTANYSHIRADIIYSLGGLALGSIVKRVSKNKRLSAFTDSLFENSTTKEPPFGIVLVWIGPRGLPEDVEAVSISRLARESNREESEVINELREKGYLLLSEKAFSLLIENLINDVQEGQLHLPISMKKLSGIEASGAFGLESSGPE